MDEGAGKRIVRAWSADAERGFEVPLAHKAREYGISIERGVEMRENPYANDFSGRKAQMKTAFSVLDLHIPRAKDLRMRAATVFEIIVTVVVSLVLAATLTAIIFDVANQFGPVWGPWIAAFIAVLLLGAFLDMTKRR